MSFVEGGPRLRRSNGGWTSILHPFLVSWFQPRRPRFENDLETENQPKRETRTKRREKREREDRPPAPPREFLLASKKRRNSFGHIEWCRKNRTAPRARTQRVHVSFASFHLLSHLHVNDPDVPRHVLGSRRSRKRAGPTDGLVLATHPGMRR